MSDGKSFAPNRELTDGERLVELERKYAVIQERIQAYDNVLREFQVLRQANGNISDYLDLFVDESRKSQADLKSVLSSHASRILENHNKIGALSSSIKEVDSRLENNLPSIDMKFSSISERIQSLPEQTKKLVEGKVNSQDFDAHKQEAHERASIQEKSLRATRDYISTLQASITSLSESISTNKEMINEQGKAIQTFLVWINTFEDKIEKKLKESQLSTSAKMASDYMSFLDKLAEMKEELLGTPTSNASVEKRILSKLDITTTEAANAVRMMQTNQDRIKLLEKKVESLTTQLTKYEIK